MAQNRVGISVLSHHPVASGGEVDGILFAELIKEWAGVSGPTWFGGVVVDHVGIVPRLALDLATVSGDLGTRAPREPAFSAVPH
ncbi:unannotated protein [freshwater metagenome]|uniref:Unannotated protein n=1 Tax=freshwater metagenome TaxID=449393 RepID=A0A6J6WID2_9ZZZZ